MTEHIIELRDAGVRLSRAGEILTESPGFANVAGKDPLFGEEARRRFRLHPRQSFNQFWSSLSLDPLANADHFRHHADLAHGHLGSIAAETGLEGDAVFVVPSNYNRNQLAILLGLVRQSPVRAVGLVDLAVAASLGAAARDALFVDVQLHQTVLTRLLERDGRLQRDTVLQIPGSGLLALHDTWAAMIRDAFIKQSRFDPLHNAETEQYIYNRMEEWLAAVSGGNEALLEINHKGAVYQAKVNRGFFEQKARNILLRIRQELDALGGAGTDVLMPAPMAALPGMGLYVPGALAVGDASVAVNCLSLAEHIVGNPESLNFVTGLPLPQGSAPARATRREGNLPSHILVNHKAYPLPPGMLYLGPRLEAVPGGQGISFIELDDPALGGLITISRQEQGYVLEPGANGALRVNGEPAPGARPLALGDRINFVNSGTSLQLIQVQ